MKIHAQVNWLERALEELALPSGFKPPAGGFLCGILLSTFLAHAANAGAPAPPVSGNAVEQIRRSDPLTDSAQETAKKAKRSLGEPQQPGATQAPGALPATWLDSKGCSTVDAIEVRLHWYEKSGTQRNRKFADQALHGPCPGAAVVGAAVSSILDQLRSQGYVVTQMVLNDGTVDAKGVMDVRVLSLAQVWWPDGVVSSHRYGLSLPEGEPLQLTALDSIVELMGRLRRNDVHLAINPDADLHTASVVVSNQEGSASTLVSALDHRRDLSTWANSWVLENTMGLQERWGLSVLYGELPGGSTRTSSLDFEVPYGRHLFSWSVSQSNTLTPVNDGQSTSTLTSDAQDLRLGWKGVLHRSSRSAYGLSLDWQQKEISSTFLGVGLRSLSPKLSIVELGANAKHLAKDGAVWVLDADYSRGLLCCGANDDDALGVDDLSAAHAQFERVQASAIYSKQLKFDARDVNFNMMGQYFFSPVGLYPSVQFALASTHAVDGVFRSQSLVDKGWSLRAEISTPLKFTETMPPAQLAISYAYAEGVRYNDGLSSILHGAKVGLNFYSGRTATALFVYLPGHNSSMQNESVSLGAKLSMAFF